MKNLMIYISPNNFSKDTFGEIHLLPKIQIENSLGLGWRKEDILLLTNFDYEYMGVKSVVIPDHCYCDFSPTATKIKAIIHLFSIGIKDFFWFHDLDAFQINKISESDVKKEMGNCDIGMTDYGRSSINRGRDLRWSTGTIFFNSKSKDIFSEWWEQIESYKVNEEIMMLEMLKKKRFKPIKQRIKKLNISYNLATRRRDIKYAYGMADKPLKVLHFHPFDKRDLEMEEPGINNLDLCMYGKGRIGKPLMSESLIKIFNKNNIN